MTTLLSSSLKRYDGDIDPKTQHRNGKGTYNYRNPYFKYVGDWAQNKKHGQGRLELGDGSYYEGEFLNGEMTGNGIMNWANGNCYQGAFVNGAKHGTGEFKSKDGSFYQGEWRNNLREGKGKLTLEDGTVIEGEFKQHKPFGEIKLEDSEGVKFVGKVVNGIKNGYGVWENTRDGIKYRGEWENDKKHGQGILSFEEQGYSYDGIFIEDKPEYIASIFTVGLPPSQENEEAKQVEESAGLKNAKTSKVDVKAVPETPKDTLSYSIGSTPLTFEIQVCYQGADYEDPVQPTKEEIEEKIKLVEKDRKKQKNAPPLNVEEFYKPRMITPPPMCVTMDSGRKLELNLYERVENEKEKEPTYKMLRLDYRKLIANKRADIQTKKEELEKLIEEYKEAEAKGLPKDTTKDAKGKKVTKKDAKAEPSPLDQKVDEHILLFNPQEPDSDKSIIATTDTGLCTVSGLEFPEDFPAGRYRLKVRDITDIQELPKLHEYECDLIINPADGVLDDKKKKKK